MSRSGKTYVRFFYVTLDESSIYLIGTFNFAYCEKIRALYPPGHHAPCKKIHYERRGIELVNVAMHTF